jgi:hypothetical protein
MKTLKHLCFIGIAVFLASAMVSCDFFSSQEDETPSVEYIIEDGNISAVTLRIDGKGGPVMNMSRALTDSLAKAGHDFYEVVFTDGTTIARASWEIGEPAVIQNVPRNGDTGIDYAIANRGTFAPGEGAAILFVGRKADKALLAVGLLTEVDGVGGTPVPNVTETTRTVTFKAAALTAKADFIVAGSSFLTAAKDLTGDTGAIPPIPPYGIVNAVNTTVQTAVYDGQKFPLYRLPHNQSAIAASYTIACTDTTNAAIFTTAYCPGIISTGDSEIENRVPRYPKLGTYPSLPQPHVLLTVPTLTNNTTADLPFVPGITMSFDTSAYATADLGGVVSVVFNIPVFAITADDNPAGTDPTPASITWNIKPGFGANYYNLDNGTGAAGGAILLGVGDVSLNSLEIITTSW